MLIKMKVPYDDGIHVLVKKQEADLPEKLALKLIRVGLAELPSTITKPSMSMLRSELVAIAQDRGIELETDDNKADILAKIEAGEG
jgi:hypothetical protein